MDSLADGDTDVLGDIDLLSDALGLTLVEGLIDLLSLADGEMDLLSLAEGDIDLLSDALGDIDLL